MVLPFNRSYTMPTRHHEVIYYSERHEGEGDRPAGNGRRRFLPRFALFQKACESAWYTFILAGTGAIAFSNKAVGLTTTIVGSFLIVSGSIMFVIAISDR